MPTKLLKGGILFLACEFICFSFLSFLHQTFLNDDIKMMAFYEENYPNSISFFVPVLIGLGLILFVFFLSGEVNLLAPIVPILIAFYLIIDAATNMELAAFNYYFLRTYGPYLLILTILWGIVFGIHTIICHHCQKKNKKREVMKRV